MNADIEKFVMPAVSMNEQPTSYTFTFTVPGIGKKDADLHVEGRTLTLKTHATWQNPAGFHPVEAEFSRDCVISFDYYDLPEGGDLPDELHLVAGGVLQGGGVGHILADPVVENPRIVAEVHALPGDVELDLASHRRMMFCASSQVTA